MDELAVHNVVIEDGRLRLRPMTEFEKNGYVIDQAIQQPPGSKATIEYDLILTRETWAARQPGRQGA